jgi:hypothetical protein
MGDLTMDKEKFDKLLDYFPIIAYFGFWLQGAAISSVFTGDPRLVALGFVTAPAIAAMLWAAFNIRRRHKNA